MEVTVQGAEGNENGIPLGSTATTECGIMELNLGRAELLCGPEFGVAPFGQQLPSGLGGQELPQVVADLEEDEFDDFDEEDFDDDFDDDFEDEEDDFDYGAHELEGDLDDDDDDAEFGGEEE